MIRPRIVAIVQARMGSTRLPGKTLADLGGKPLIERVIERVRVAQRIGGIVIATTDDPEDQAIIAWARAHGIAWYAGSRDDVLDRFYRAAKEAGADLIVRITADDPFKDPEVVDRVIGRMLASPDLDYASNTLHPTYPEGLDVEVIRFPALERAWQQARLHSEREHVTPFIWKHPDRFRLASVEHDIDLSRLRWTIDYENDLRFAREVYARFPDGRVFLMKEILDLLARHPEIAAINQGIDRNEGFRTSLARDDPPEP